jgi:hypothetical protein
MRKNRLPGHMRKVHGNDDPSRDKRMSTCDICGVRVRRDRLQKHVERVHTEKPEKKKDLATCMFCGAIMHRKELAAHCCAGGSSQLAELEPPTPIILESKRGKRIGDSKHCSECHGLFDVVWRYAKSNMGVVYLCSSCKPIVFDRSFGPADAMNRAWISSFESNRRKH